MELSPLSRPNNPNESAPGLPSEGSPWRPLSEPEARDGNLAEGSSLAQSSEVDEPYSHSAWRF